jgi:hypothetical protein
MATTDEGVQCPICTAFHTLEKDEPPTGCFLQAAGLYLIYERGSLTQEQGLDGLERTNADAFCEAMGEVMDRVEDGEFLICPDCKGSEQDEEGGDCTRCNGSGMAV